MLPKTETLRHVLFRELSGFIKETHSKDLKSTAICFSIKFEILQTTWNHNAYFLLLFRLKTKHLIFFVSFFQVACKTWVCYYVQGRSFLFCKIQERPRPWGPCQPWRPWYLCSFLFFPWKITLQLPRQNEAQEEVKLWWTGFALVTQPVLQRRPNQTELRSMYSYI